SLVLLGQLVPALVEHGQAHDVEADVHVTDLLDLQQPAGRDPRPWANRVEPHVGGDTIGHGEVPSRRVAPAVRRLTSILTPRRIDRHPNESVTSPTAGCPYVEDSDRAGRHERSADGRRRAYGETWDGDEQCRECVT